MNQFEIYWDDLTPECQKRLRDWLGGNNGNYDVLPIVSLEPHFIQEVEFVSYWNDSEIAVTTKAKYNPDTGLVYDVEGADVDGLDTLDAEFAIIDGEEYCVEDNGDGTYTVIK